MEMGSSGKRGAREGLKYISQYSGMGWMGLSVNLGWKRGYSHTRTERPFCPCTGQEAGPKE